MASLDASTAADALVSRLKDDPQFKEAILEDPIGAMSALGIQRDLAWDLLSFAHSGAKVDQAEASERQVGPLCSGWLTKAGCQCTGFEMVCAARTAYMKAACTTKECG